MHLEGTGDRRNLIRFVEAWSAVAEPTVPAQLAGIRAFIDLGMMDRAWIRLERVLEDERCGVEAQALAARLFLARGWFNRARGYLSRALEAAPDDPELGALLQEANEPPTEADVGPAADDASADTLAVRARQAMAQGSFVRARALLERARRKQADNAHVADLLWVMKGDFAADGTLAELTQRWGPGFAPLPDLFTIGGDEREHTESASRTEIRRALLAEAEPQANPAFRGLFRGLHSPDAPTDEDGLTPGAPDPGEVTAVSSLQRLADGAVPVDFADATSDDTQIQLVIRKGDEADDDTAVHEHPGGPPPVKPSSDLGFEAEDDDLIIVTRRDEDTLEPDPTTDVGAVRLDPDSERPTREAAQLVDEGAAWAKPATLPTVPPAPRRPQRKRRTRRGPPQWVVFAVAFLVTATALSALLAIFFAGQVYFGMM